MRQCHVVRYSASAFCSTPSSEKGEMAAIGGVNLARQATGASIPPALSALSRGGGRLSCLRFPVRGVRCSAAPEASAADAPASKVSGREGQSQAIGWDTRIVVTCHDPGTCMPEHGHRERRLGRSMTASSEPISAQPS